MKKSVSCHHIVPALSATSMLSSTSASFGNSTSNAPSSKFTSTYTASRRPAAGTTSVSGAGGTPSSTGPVSRTATSGAAAPVAAASTVKLTEEDIERQFRAIARPSVPCADSWSFRSIFPSGSILPNCILAVDCDEDGMDELIVGSTDGLLAIIKTTLRVPVATIIVQGTIAALSFESGSQTICAHRHHYHSQGGVGGVNIMDNHNNFSGASATTAAGTSSVVAATSSGAGGGMLPRSTSMAHLNTTTGVGSHTPLNSNSAVSLSNTGGGGGAAPLASSTGSVHESFANMSAGDRRQKGGGYNMLYVTSLEGLVTVIDVKALIQNAGATTMGGVVADGGASNTTALSGSSVVPTRVDPMTLDGTTTIGNHTAMPPPLTITAVTPSTSHHHHHNTSNVNGSAASPVGGGALNATIQKMDQTVGSGHSSPLVASSIPPLGGLPPPMQHSNSHIDGAVNSTSAMDGKGKGSLSISLPAPPSSAGLTNPSTHTSVAPPSTSHNNLNTMSAAQTPNTSSSPPHSAHLSGRHHHHHHHSGHTHAHHNHHHQPPQQQQLLPVVLGVHVIPANVTCSAIVGDLLIVGSLDRRIYVFRRITMELRRSYFLASQVCAIQPFNLPPPLTTPNSDLASPLSPNQPHPQPPPTASHPRSGNSTSLYGDKETSACGVGHALPGLDPHTSCCVIVATTMHVLLIDVGDLVTPNATSAGLTSGGASTPGNAVTTAGTGATPVLMSSYIQQHSDVSVIGGGAVPIGPDKSRFSGNAKGGIGGGMHSSLSSTLGRQQQTSSINASITNPNKDSHAPHNTNNNFKVTSSPAASMVSLPSASSATATNASLRQTANGDPEQHPNHHHRVEHVDGDEFTFAYWVHPIDRNSFTIHGGRPVLGSCGAYIMDNHHPNSPQHGGGDSTTPATGNSGNQKQRGGGGTKKNNNNNNNSPYHNYQGGSGSGGSPLLMNPRLVSSCHTTVYGNSTYLAVSTEDGYSSFFEFQWMTPSQAAGHNDPYKDTVLRGGEGPNRAMTSSFHSQDKGSIGGAGSKGATGEGGGGYSNASPTFRSLSISTTASGGFAATAPQPSTETPIFPTTWVPATVGGVSASAAPPLFSPSTTTPPLSANTSAVSLTSLVQFPSTVGAPNPPPPLAPIAQEVPVMYVRQLWGVKVFGGAQRIYVVPVARKNTKSLISASSPPTNNSVNTTRNVDANMPTSLAQTAASSSILRPSITAHQDKHPGHLGRMLPAKSPKAIITTTTSTTSSCVTPKHLMDPNTAGGGSSGRFPPSSAAGNPVSNNNSNIHSKAVAVVAAADPSSLLSNQQLIHHSQQQQQHYHDLVVVIGTSTGQLFVIDRNGSTLLSRVPEGAMSFLPIQPPPLSCSTGGAGAAVFSPPQQHHHNLQLDSLNLVSVSVRELVLMNVSTSHLGAEGISRSVSCSGTLSAASTTNFVDMIRGAQNCSKAIFRPGAATTNSSVSLAVSRLPTMGTRGLDSEWFSSLMCGIMQAEVTTLISANNGINGEDGGGGADHHQPLRRLQFASEGSVDLPPQMGSTAPGQQNLHDLPSFQPPNLHAAAVGGGSDNFKSISSNHPHIHVQMTPTSMSPDQQLSQMTSSVITALAEVANKFQEHFLNNDVSMTVAAAVAELEGGGHVVGGGTVPWKDYGVSPNGSSAPGVGNLMNPVSLSFGGGSTNNNKATLQEDEAHAAAMYTVGVLLHGYSDRHWDVFAAAAAEGFPS